MHKLAEKFFGQPWHMLPPDWEARMIRLEDLPRGDWEKEGARCERPTVDAWGDPIAQARMVGNVAIVPVHGPMLKGATPYDKWLGYVGHEDIAADLTKARNAGAKAILMHMNSPGGTARGTPELASFVARMVKQGTPIFDYTEDVKASAAEYITAGATARFSTPSATLGSIGTMMETVDASKMLERVGIQYNIFASGKYKAMGHFAKPLTDEQSAFLQDWVMQRTAEFQGHMVNYRPNVDLESMQGQIFTGTGALNAGLIDALVTGLDEAIAVIS